MYKPVIICLFALLWSSCSRSPAVQAAHDFPSVAVAQVKAEDLSHSLKLTAEFKP